VPAKPPAPAAAVSAPDDPYRDMLLLTKSIMIIQRHYVDEEKTDFKNLIHSALRGVMQSLDPHSQFLEPEMVQDIKEDTSGEFGGVGIVIGFKDGVLSVVAPMEDTPAYRAGLLAGDKIVEINGEKTEGITMRDALHKIRGEKGTPIRFKVLRERDLKDFTVVRDVIRVPSVKGARMLDEAVGYVRITQFSEPTAQALQEAMEKLFQRDMKALVLDLRNNPGGLLSAAVEVSEKFLSGSALIVSTRGRGGRQNQPPARAGGKYHYTDIPLAVLINEGTASAAEIVAGALQDHKRAVLIGTTTFGKGSVQSVIPLDEGTAMRLTTAKYYTPSERVIHEKGIDPDVVVPVSPGEWQDVQARRARIENPELFADQEMPENLARAVDRPLERAVDLLKGILLFESRE
jgi:carboxyl-terminal processing protease